MVANERHNTENEDLRVQGTDGSDSAAARHVGDKRVVERFFLAPLLNEPRTLAQDEFLIFLRAPRF